MLVHKERKRTQKVMPLHLPCSSITILTVVKIAKTAGKLMLALISLIKKVQEKKSVMNT